MFDLTFHINRLAETARLMSEQPGDAIDGTNSASSTKARLPEALLSADRLRPLVVQALQSAISHFEDACPEHTGELKLTVLTHGEGERPNVCAHVSPLPPRPPPPVKVQVRERKRRCVHLPLGVPLSALGTCTDSKRCLRGCAFGAEDLNIR